MRTLAVIATATLLSTAAQAQFTFDYLRAADDYYRKGDFFSAAQYYEKYLANKKGKHAGGGQNPYVVQAASKKTAGARPSSDAEAVYNTAESYRQLNYHVKAEPFYKQASEQYAAQFPLAKYHYATTLRALERYAEAEAAFKSFMEGYGQTDTYSAAAQREIQNLQFIQQQLGRKDMRLFTVNKATSGLNDTGAAYAPVWIGENSLLFTSTRPVPNDKSKSYINRVYEATMSGGVPSGVVPVGLAQEGETHQGVVAATPDGNTMFLTRWTIGKGSKNASIYSARKSGGAWSNPEPLASLNVDGANTQQPFVMPGGQQLLFSSNRAGGSGGYDLYMADLGADGSVSNIRNLGPSINTAFDEQAPYYHAASGSLVFASNGRVGMGEFDLYWSKGTAGNWSEPQNFGYPVNSVKDDIYFASKGTARNILEDVLFSSDRSSACCLELFSLQKKRPLKMISGTVMSCDNRTPIAGAQVNIMDTVNNRTVATLTTDASGRYSFTLEEFQPLKAVASNNNYYANFLSFNTPANTDEDELTNPELCLTAIKYDEPVVVDNVYYDFGKADLKEESFPELDKLVKLMQDNPNIKAEISAHTDAVGSDAANMKLSEARAQSVVNYMISKGITTDRFVVKGYGETQPLEPNKNPDGTDNPAGREKNRRTEFKVIKN
ncbi:OmpA family protein [Flaviaesturariibacter amylovorans]|uniref:OmpA family protein n=1 Tax=Flaviaesturariibacter amylovorans TaxID=1084520 RepID=A0ABP8GK04_9BACT